MTDAAILRHWSAQARRFGTRPEASWADRLAIDLEVRTIGRHLAGARRVLDAGCGNGHAALRQAGRRAFELTGVDRSPAMVRNARRAAAGRRCAPRVRFLTGDLRRLPFADGSFDRVYTTRALINLTTWSDQKKALLECLRVLRPGGRAVFSESFIEPMRRLNVLRRTAGLPPLAQPAFNRYLDGGRLERFLRGRGWRFQAEDFSSVYYLGTRFLRELVEPPQTAYSCAVNRTFFGLERSFSARGFGIQRLYVVRRDGPVRKR